MSSHSACIFFFFSRVPSNFNLRLCDDMKSVILYYAL